MSIPGSANPLLLASAAAPTGYEIERSLRFNSADSAYLSRTPASSGNRKTWTWAGWVKLSTSSGYLFAASSDNWNANYTTIQFNGTALRVEGSNATHNVITANIFRDYSAWMHVVVAVDTTNATSTDRIKIYVNGVEATYSTQTMPSLNSDTLINSTSYHQISGRPSGNYFNGYLADIHFIDGQALDPTSFGEFSATTGVWMPKAYTGTYGTNGFKLDFADNSSNTATTLGKDTSGNGNNWTPTNLSVTAGAGNDSLVDVPTNGTETDTGAGGEVRGNYCTFSPVDSTSGITLTDGNLRVGQLAGADQSTCGTFGVSSGKWYWEVQPVSGINAMVGVADLGLPLTSRVYPGTGAFFYYQANGSIYGPTLAGTSGAYGASFQLTSDVVGVALDMDTGYVTFYKNGVSQGVANTSSLLGRTITPCLGNGGADVVDVANFGQRPFAYTAPSGFKALNTANLPAPVVTKPSQYMDVKLYTGNGSTQTISGLDFSPDLVWLKSRSSGYGHNLVDTVRGATIRLVTNVTVAEVVVSNGLTAFTSDGFSLGDYTETNINTGSMVAWCWDAGSSTVTNTDGSITSQVRANPSAGFSIVTYTGTGANATVGHGLGTAPAMLIVKCRDVGRNWNIGHSGIAVDAWTDYLQFTTAAATDLNTLWNDTPPTSSVFSIGTSVGVNGSTETHVAYCFAPVEGYSAFGNYTGNGSADGPFVFTNMRPRWILIKRTDTTGDWTIIDTAREGYNVDNDPLFPNLSNAEGTTDLADILSNGFKLRSTDASVNASAGTYIYAAFAEAAFSIARAR